MPKKSFSLRVVKADGTDLCILPHHKSLQLSIVRSDVGSISFDYPLNGKNSDKLGGYVELRVLQNGVELRGCRFLLDDDGEDEASEDGKGRPTTWTGRTWGDAMFDKTVVYPAAMGTAATYVATGDNPGPNFMNSTPGAAVKWLVDQAKLRGCFPTLTYDFTDTHDSAGIAWPTTFNKVYDVGTKYGAVLADLRDLGLIEYEFDGRKLRLYIQDYRGGMEHDLTGPDGGPFTLRKGRDLASAPKSKTTRDTISAVLMQGDGGIYSQGTAGASDAPFRVEGFFSEGGVGDMGTLQWISGQRLNMNNHDLAERTYEIGNLENPDTPAPWADYYVGDWIFGTTGNAVQALRIAQFTVSIADDGIKSGSVVLGDLIQDKAVRLQHQIDRVEQGIVNKASSGGTVNTLDATTPKPPTSMALTTDSYQDVNGTNYAIVFISWAQVTQNTDNTPYTDAGGYRLQWKKHDAVKWGPDWTTTPDTFETSIGQLPLGVDIDVRLRAYDLSGHLSTWVLGEIVTSKDVTPPPQPSAPSVDTATFAGVARISWDGKDYLGNPMPPDFSHVEVHVDTVTPVVPSDANMTDMLLGSGVSVFAGTVLVQRYTRLVAVDRSGNKSVSSVEAGFVIRRLVDTDAVDNFVNSRLLSLNVVDTANIKDLAVGTAKMSDLAVVTAKIGDLQVNDAKIGSMSIGKLTAGLLSADMTVSARIKTADFGARAEMNSTGFYLVDASNNTLVSIAISGGSPLLVLQTSSGGTRIQLSSSQADTISFYAGGVQVGRIVADASNGLALYGGTTTNNFVSVTNNGISITGSVNGVSITPQPGAAVWINGPVQLGAVANATFFNGAPVTINIDSSAHRGLAINGVSGLSQAYIECLNNAGTRVFAVTSTGAIQSTSTTITTPSDRRLKQKVKYLRHAGTLEKLTQLKPATFEFKWAKGHLEHGLIAQDVQQVFPEHVEEEDGELRIKFPFQEHAIAAFREVAERLAELEAKVKELEAA